MNIEFESVFITSFPNQICTFEHKGKKLHCNVDRMIEEYKKEKPGVLEVDEIYRYISKIDAEYAVSTTNNNPIIVVKFDDNTYEILDGNHRLYRAFSEGKEKIEAYVLDENDLKRYII